MAIVSSIPGLDRADFDSVETGQAIPEQVKGEISLDMVSGARTI